MMGQWIHADMQRAFTPAVSMYAGFQQANASLKTSFKSHSLCISLYFFFFWAEGLMRLGCMRALAWNPAMVLAARLSNSALVMGRSLSSSSLVLGCWSSSTIVELKAVVMSVSPPLLASLPPPEGLEAAFANSGSMARATVMDRLGSLGRRFAPRVARDASLGFLCCSRLENCSISSLLRCSMI